MDSSYTVWVGHGHRQSGQQGKARDNLAAIFQEMPSRSIIRHTAALCVFLAKLCSASCRQFTVPDGTDCTDHTHHCWMDSVTRLYFIFSSTILTVSVITPHYGSCSLHIWRPHTHTPIHTHTTSCQQFSISRESGSADANMESMCFSQCDLWPLRLTHRWEAPFLFLLHKPPHNLLKATISSLLSLTTDGAVMYACLRAAVWLMLGGRNGHFTPTTLQLLFSSVWQTECFQQQDELLAVESCLAQD